MVQPVRAILEIHQFQLGTRQVDRGGNDVQARHLRMHHRVIDPRLAQQDVIAGEDALAVGNAQAGRGVALRIEVDQQHLQPRGRQRRGKIDGAGGLAHPALLVRDRNADHRAPTRSRITIDESVDVMLCST